MRAFIARWASTDLLSSFATGVAQLAIRAASVSVVPLCRPLSVE
jgi:hypothetical protein